MNLDDALVYSGMAACGVLLAVCGFLVVNELQRNRAARKVFAEMDKRAEAERNAGAITFGVPPGYNARIREGKVVELAIILYDVERDALVLTFPERANGEENMAVLHRFGVLTDPPDSP